MSNILFEKRILSLDPANRGIGFAVMEGPVQLVDWGVKEVRENCEKYCLRKVENLINLYQPETVVIEGAGFRRAARTEHLKSAIALLCRKKNVDLFAVSRHDYRKFFAARNARTKDEIAAVIAEQFAELSLRLPPIRKFWMSEDYRMSIFDAVALGLTYIANFCNKEQ